MANFNSLLFGEDLVKSLSLDNFDFKKFGLGDEFKEEEEEQNNDNNNDNNKARIKKKKKKLNIHERIKSKLVKDKNEILNDKDDDEEFDKIMLTKEKNFNSNINIGVLYKEGNDDVYRLTDCFIPYSKVLRKTMDKYLEKIIENKDSLESNENEEGNKKDKEDKFKSNDNTSKKTQEQQDIIDLIKKAKTIQKYIKVSYTYDEKFFDKTLFKDIFEDKNLKNNKDKNKTSTEALENKNYNRLFRKFIKQNNNPIFYLSNTNESDNNENLSLQEENNVIIKFPKDDDLFDEQFNIYQNNKNQINTIQEVTKKENSNNQNIDIDENKVIENKLIDSLYNNLHNFLEENVINDFNKDKKGMENKTLIKECNNNSFITNNEEIENEVYEILDNYNNDIESKILKFYSVDVSNINKDKYHIPLNKDNIQNENDTISVVTGTITNNLSQIQPQNKNISSSLNPNFAQPNQSVLNLNTNTNVSITNINQEQSLVKDNNPFLISRNLGFRKKQILQSKYIEPDSHLSNSDENLNTLFLSDFLKRKRYHFPIYPNQEILSGRFINSILLDNDDFEDNEKRLANFRLYSKRIYDLNDYNMQFEIENNDKNNKEEGLNSLRKKSEDYDYDTERLFSVFLKKNVIESLAPKNPNNSGKLKVVKSKNNMITHAKCAYSLIYNKIHLSFEELKNFHRPDFTKYLLNIKKNIKSALKDKYKGTSSITTIDGIYNHLENKPLQHRLKSFPVIVRTNDMLKEKEYKRTHKNLQYMNAYEVFKNHLKLSLSEGKFALFENLDEEPLLINNFGMASRLKKYLFSNKLYTPNAKLNDSENKTVKLLGPNGVNIPMQEGQKIPLLGQLNKTDLKGIAVIDNKMFKAPVFYEKPMPKLYLDESTKKEIDSSVLNDNIKNEDNLKDKKKKNRIGKVNNLKKNVSSNSKINIDETVENNIKFDTYEKKATKRMEFLLVGKKINPKTSFNDNNTNASENIEFYIREIDHMYSIGQEEPKVEVYQPHSKQFVNYLKKKIHTYVNKLYDEVNYKAGINFKFFTNLFPNITEQILKRTLKEIGIEIDKNICFFNPNKPVNKTENTITPENVCQYESCLYGIYKLKSIGIRNITNSDKISYATSKYIESIKDENEQKICRVIEEEILTTPWNLTNNYLQSKMTGGMLSIKGIGDPSNGNGGYSFIKMPVKQYNAENKTLKDEIDVLKEMNKNIKTVTGTDADLRKLPKRILKLKLLQMGEDEEHINKLSRWERVFLLRYKSNKAAELGYEGDLTKYARGDRIGTNAQKETYQNNINDVFKVFIDYISSIDTIYCFKNYQNENKNNKNGSSTKISFNFGNGDNKNSLLQLNEDKNDNLNNENELSEYSTGYFEMQENEEDDDLIYDKSKDNKACLGLYPSMLLKKKKKNFNKNDKFLKLHSKIPSTDLDTKISLEMKRDDIEFLKLKHRRQQGFDKFYEYDDNRSSVVRRRFQPERKLNEIFEDITDSCFVVDKTKIFNFPVKKKEFPEYFTIISKPIDLSTIKNKCKRNEYFDVETFKSDFSQMVINSELFNGSQEVSTISRQAQIIYDHVCEKLEEKNEIIEEEKRKLNSQ